MSTPLMFGAAFLQNKLTSYLYPHIISFNPTTCRWQIEKNKWKLIPFCMATIGVVILFGMNLCIIQIFKYIFYPKTISGFVVGFMSTLVALSLLCWAYSVPSMKFGECMVSYINALVDFEARVEQFGRQQHHVLHVIMKKLNFSDSIGVSGSSISWTYYFRELRKELKLLITGPSCDYFGLFENAATFYLLTFGWFVVPIGLYFHFEPYYYTLKDLGLIDLWHPIVTIAIRATFSYICVIETCRTFILFFCPVIQLSCIYHRCLEIIKNLPLCRDSFRVYTQVLLLHKWGDWMAKYAFAVYLGEGIYLSIIFNIFTLVGWKVFPMPLYLMCVPLTALIYFLMFTIPPLWVKTHHISLHLVRHQWPMRAVAGECKDVRMNELKRIFKRMQLITFHSGDVATLDNETKRNYLGHILYYTMSLLLLFESSVNSGHHLNH